MSSRRRPSKFSRTTDRIPLQKYHAVLVSKRCKSPEIGDTGGESRAQLLLSQKGEDVEDVEGSEEETAWSRRLEMGCGYPEV